MNLFKHEETPLYTDISQLPCVEEIKELENIRIFKLKGPIDMETIPRISELEEKAQEKKGAIEKNIIVDFKDVTHVDSATCAALVRAFATLKSEHRKLALVSVTDDLKSLMDISRITPLFSIYDTEQEAIQSIEVS